MCRDGLFPRRLAHVRHGSAHQLGLTMGFVILIALLAAFVPLGAIVELVMLGRSSAFWSTSASSCCVAPGRI